VDGSSLDAKISLLAGEVRPFLWVTNWDRVEALIGEIAEAFKSVRYHTVAERQAAWERFADIRQDARERRSNERTAFAERSKSHRDTILHEVRASTALPGHTRDDKEWMKRHGRRLSAASQYLTDHKTEMRAADKNECFGAIAAERAEHEAWWEEYKRQAQERADDHHSRVVANLERNRERYQRVAESLERAENHADDLRSQIASAWSESFVARASDWLAEAEARCDGLRQRLAEIESWIAEDERRLR
jgi:hypothetical protein